MGRTRKIHQPDKITFIAQREQIAQNISWFAIPVITIFLIATDAIKWEIFADAFAKPGSDDEGIEYLEHNSYWASVLFFGGTSIMLSLVIPKLFNRSTSHFLSWYYPATLPTNLLSVVHKSRQFATVMTTLLIGSYVTIIAIDLGYHNQQEKLREMLHYLQKGIPESQRTKAKCALTLEALEDRLNDYIVTEKLSVDYPSVLSQSMNDCQHAKLFDEDKYMHGFLKMLNSLKPTILHLTPAKKFRHKMKGLFITFKQLEDYNVYSDARYIGEAEALGIDGHMQAINDIHQLRFNITGPFFFYLSTSIAIMIALMLLKWYQRSRQKTRLSDQQKYLKKIVSGSRTEWTLSGDGINAAHIFTLDTTPYGTAKMRGIFYEELTIILREHNYHDVLNEKPKICLFTPSLSQKESNLIANGLNSRLKIRNKINNSFPAQKNFLNDFLQNIFACNWQYKLVRPNNRPCAEFSTNAGNLDHKQQATLATFLQYRFKNIKVFAINDKFVINGLISANEIENFNLKEVQAILCEQLGIEIKIDVEAIYEYSSTVVVRTQKKQEFSSSSSSELSGTSTNSTTVITWKHDSRTITFNGSNPQEPSDTRAREIESDHHNNRFFGIFSEKILKEYQAGNADKHFKRLMNTAWNANFVGQEGTGIKERGTNEQGSFFAKAKHRSTEHRLLAQKVARNGKAALLEFNKFDKVSHKK